MAGLDPATQCARVCERKESFDARTRACWVAASRAAMVKVGRPRPNLRRVFAPLAQELEELDAFAQAALHHVRRAHHFADDGRDLARAEIELLVEALQRREDLVVGEMRVVQRRDLDA